MSKSSVKKLLKSFTKEQIIDVVMELYDARKEAKEFLEFFAQPNEESKVEEYKRIIEAEFFPLRGDAKLRFSVCKKAISDFKKLKPSPTALADLMVYYMENACEFTGTFGDMWEQYYESVEGNFKRTLDFLVDNDLLAQFQPRIKKCLEWTDKCGWGFPDVLYQFYYEAIADSGLEDTDE